jgi:hypothetical protein
MDDQTKDDDEIGGACKVNMGNEKKLAGLYNFDWKA